MRDARRKMERALASGAAAEKFAAMVHALCGPHDVLDRSDAHLAPAPCIGEVEAPIDGFISAIDTRALGLAVVMLGGGRSVPGAAVDPAVGLSDLAGIGDEVGRHRPLCRIHARSEADAEEASAVVQQGYSIGDKRPERRSPIIDRIVAAQ